mgnify:CR=1 FL=1
MKHLKSEKPDTHAVYMAMLERIHKESKAKFDDEKKALKRTLHVFSQKVIDHQIKN